MPEIFRDPVWQFWGVVVGLISIVYSIAWDIGTRQRKELSYEVLDSGPLDLNNKDEAQQDSQSANYYYCSVGFFNSGTQPILPADFHRPLTLVFADNTTVVIAKVTHSNPQTLRTANVTIQQRDKVGWAVILDSILLNPDCWLILTAVLDQPAKLAAVEGEIVGVRVIKNVWAPSTALWKKWLMSSLQFLYGLSFLIGTFFVPGFLILLVVGSIPSGRVIDCLATPLWVGLWTLYGLWWYKAVSRWEAKRTKKPRGHYPQ